MRRIGWVLAATAASALVAFLGTGAAAPAERPSTPVTEQNVDANGLIRVHEQGTANVSIQGTPAVTLGGSATVNARQDGAWNVGIAGTPSVGLAPSANTVQLDGAASGRLDAIVARLTAIENALGPSGGSGPTLHSVGFSALSLIPAGGEAEVSLLDSPISVVILNRAHDDPDLRVTVQGPSGAFVLYGGGDRNEVVQLPAPFVAERAVFSCSGGGACEVGFAFLALVG